MTLLQLIKQQGNTLVITGAQGCGKTLLAQQLAKAEGNYNYARIEQIVGKNSTFQNWLNDSPNVVIVEGEPKLKHLDKTKQLVVSNTLTHNSKGQDPIEVKTPMFIFCTSNPKPLNFGENNRRFYVLDLDT